MERTVANVRGIDVVGVAKVGLFEYDGFPGGDKEYRVNEEVSARSERSYRCSAYPVGSVYRASLKHDQ